METLVRHPVAEPVASARSVLAEGAAAPVWSFADRELAEALTEAGRLAAQAEELRLRLLGQMDSRGLARAAGATSTAALVRDSQRVSQRAAGRDVALAGALDRNCERTRAALTDGRVNVEQARVIVNALADLVRRVTTLADHEREQAEDYLIEMAAVFGPDELRRLGKRVFEVIDPAAADAREGELLDDEEERARQLCRLAMRRCGDGSTRGSFRLPDAQADMLRAVLEAMSSPRRTGTGDAGSGARDPGADEALAAYPVRMGRAFSDLVEHLPVDRLPQHGGVSAQLVITVDHQVLQTGLGAATLSSGTRISAGQARRLACNAGLLPAVMDGRSTVLDLGRSSRLFSIKQRIALGITQQGCVWAGCDRPAAWCEAHHARCPWADGGNTDLADGVLLCSRHHTLAHGSWTVRIADDGVPETVPPRRIDPDQRPRRHRRFHQRE